MTVFTWLSKKLALGTGRKPPSRAGADSETTTASGVKAKPVDLRQTAAIDRKLDVIDERIDLALRRMME